MPRLKPTAQQSFDERVAHNIRVLGMRHDVRSDINIAKKANLAKSTFAKKIKEPRTFRLAELYQIAAAFGEPITALFEECEMR